MLNNCALYYRDVHGERTKSRVENHQKPEHAEATIGNNAEESAVPAPSKEKDSPEESNTQESSNTAPPEAVAKVNKDLQNNLDPVSYSSDEGVVLVMDGSNGERSSAEPGRQKTKLIRRR